MISILTNIEMLFDRSWMCWWRMPLFRNWKMVEWSKSKSRFEMMIIIKCCTIGLIISSIRIGMIDKVRGCSTICAVVMSWSYTSRRRGRWRKWTVTIDWFLKSCMILRCFIPIVCRRIGWRWRRWWCTIGSLLRTCEDEKKWMELSVWKQTCWIWRWWLS